MIGADYRTVEDAREFLNMMRRAYHEVWRRRFSGDSQISVISVLVIFEDCEHYRRELARLAIEAYEEGRDPPAQDIYSELDATWRSLLSAVKGKKPKFAPPLP